MLCPLSISIALTVGRWLNGSIIVSHLRQIINRLLIAGVMCALMTTSGCMTQRSNIYGPGTIEVQRRRAVRLDPYPNQDIGPEVVGGRPRDFQEDRSEANRAGLLREAWWGLPF